jgi:hypothetical protein
MCEIEVVNNFLMTVDRMLVDINERFASWVLSDGKHWLSLYVFPAEKTFSFSVCPIDTSLNLPEGPPFFSIASTYLQISNHSTKEAGNLADCQCLRFDIYDGTTSFDLVKSESGFLHARTVINRHRFPVHLREQK